MKYKTMEETKMRKELVEYLTPQCNGLISKKEMKSFVAKLPLKSLINRSYELTLTESAEEMSKHLTLTNITDAHSWAGNSGYVQEGEILKGNADFGEDYHYQYSDNGNITEDTDDHSLPDFDCSKLCVAFISCHDWSNNGENYWSTDKEYDNYSYKLVIYLPAKKNKKVS